MPANFNYSRLKEPGINSTDMSMSVMAAEKPEVPEELDGVNTPNAGTTGEADIRIQADADESGGVDKQDLFKIECLPVVNATAPGTTSLKVTVTPILGGGTDGTPQTFSVPHDEDMDAWQTAAGRPRQT